MKSACNGGLQLSVLDGWWAEAYDGDNGWALPGEAADHAAAQDLRDAKPAPRPARRGDRARLLRARRARDSRALGGADAGVAALARARFSTARALGEYLSGPYRG
jgi:hypothetical protein